jgi:hypothetical protein
MVCFLSWFSCCGDSGEHLFAVHCHLFVEIGGASGWNLSSARAPNGFLFDGTPMLSNRLRYRFGSCALRLKAAVGIKRKAHQAKW